MTERLRQQRAALMKKISMEDGCWVWTGALGSDGYAGGWKHRASYKLFIGPVPPGHELDHICRNRACVNPYHLQPVSKSWNQHIGYVKRRRQMRPSDLREARLVHDRLTGRLMGDDQLSVRLP